MSLSQGWWMKPSQWTKWGRCWMACRWWCVGRWRWSSSTQPTPMCCCSGSSSHKLRSFTFDCRVISQSWRTGEQWGRFRFRWVSRLKNTWQAFEKRWHVGFLPHEYKMCVFRYYGTHSASSKVLKDNIFLFSVHKSLPCSCKIKVALMHWQWFTLNFM